LASGKIKPVRKQEGVWLFRKAVIMRLAAKRLGKAGYVNAEQTALALGITVGTLTRWRKAGKITPVRKQDRVWMYDEKEIKRVAAKLSKGSCGS
jgi:predicted site-specific integrase-resolvase